MVVIDMARSHRLFWLIQPKERPALLIVGNGDSPFVTYQALEVRSIAERVEQLFLAIQEAAARKDLDRLVTKVDRLQREVLAGPVALRDAHLV
jgi:hypothetical protein